ncbi:homing endonuclease associated repeat-containing protein [Natronorubrum daqingense]|uniref:HNH endonuclease n=1 Tax=Natronorubrum daqingense TaxID=588898 RepID=A0A1P8RI06_9EURY|nr:hypothetical protein [Natronorubrum daqingense]APX98273.1 hypothetical protein BB347_13845 [Natronorubrum daqingense]
MTTQAECLDALRDAAEELGCSPTKAQYEELGMTPASATIIRTCGGWNNAKERAGLATSYSRGSRVSPKPDDVDLPEGMSWEALTVDQRWHYRNTEWNTERTLRRRRRLRAWLNDQKQRCSRCPIDHVGCLDFHHRNPDSKTMAVGRMVTFGYGKDALRAEITKCVVLCANCHRKEHFRTLTRPLQRWVHSQKHISGGCKRCVEDDPACLDYHHNSGNKRATVAALVAANRSKQRIRTEIERCVVLCANCHRIEHYKHTTE